MCVLYSAAPRFESVENQPHDVNASVGDTVNVRCLTYAEPPATVQWFHNGKPLDRKSVGTTRLQLIHTNFSRLFLPPA